MDVALFSDEVFRFLCRFTVIENYYKRGSAAVHLEGIENTNVIGTLIARNVPGITQHIKQDITYTPVRGLDLRKKIIEESHLDGAYVLEYGHLSNKVFLQNFINSVMRHRNLKRIETLQERYLPQDFLHSGHAVALETSIVGSKTQVAIAAGLMGGRGYLIKQTTYAGLPVGKVCVFTHTGLEREFFLMPDAKSTLRNEDYFDPRRKIVGVVRVYGADKTVRQEYKITPAELKIDSRKFMPPQSMFESLLGRIPILGGAVTTHLYK